jgi:hypothetical protein
VDGVVEDSQDIPPAQREEEVKARDGLVEVAARYVRAHLSIACHDVYDT